jgi:hypothetical protein
MYCRSAGRKMKSRSLTVLATLIIQFATRRPTRSRNDQVRGRPVQGSASEIKTKHMHRSSLFFRETTTNARGLYYDKGGALNNSATMIIAGPDLSLYQDDLTRLALLA